MDPFGDFLLARGDEGQIPMRVSSGPHAYMNLSIGAIKAIRELLIMAFLFSAATAFRWWEVAALLIMILLPAL